MAQSNHNRPVSLFSAPLAGPWVPASRRGQRGAKGSREGWCTVYTAGTWPLNSAQSTEGDVYCGAQWKGEGPYWGLGWGLRLNCVCGWVVVGGGGGGCTVRGGGGRGGARRSTSNAASGCLSCGNVPCLHHRKERSSPRAPVLADQLLLLPPLPPQQYNPPQQQNTHTTQAWPLPQYSPSPFRCSGRLLRHGPPGAAYCPLYSGVFYQRDCFSFLTNERPQGRRFPSNRR